MKRYDVVGLGACGIDLKLVVPRQPGSGVKVVATDTSISGGGVTANNLVQCAKLGLSCAWLGALGNDHSADYLLNQFETEDVDVPKLVKLDSHPTQQFWTWDDAKHESSMLGVIGASRELTKETVKKEFSPFIKQCRHFHTEIAVIPLAAALEGARIAKESGAKVIVDMDGDPYYLLEHEKIGKISELEELLKITDVLKTTRQALKALTKSSTINRGAIDKILRMGPKIVAITDGSKGCIVADKNSLEKIRPIHITAIDSVGAGDAFMGGLSYALLKNFPLKEAGEFANACGAYKCTRYGTRGSGSLKEIEGIRATIDK